MDAPDGVNWHEMDVAHCPIHDIDVTGEVVSQVTRGNPERWTRLSCGHIGYELYTDDDGVWEQLFRWYDPDDPPGGGPFAYSRPAEVLTRIRAVTVDGEGRAWGWMTVAGALDEAHGDEDDAIRRLNEKARIKGGTNAHR